MSETNNALSPQSVFPQLEIIEGLHYGVRLGLEDGEYSLGPSAESDIVLRDEGVLPRHAVLRLQGGEARIEAVGGDILVGSLRVAKGNGCKLRLPTVISVGGASLQLSPAPAGRGGMASAMDRLSEHPVKIAGGVIACALVAVVASNIAGRSDSDGSAPRLAGVATADQNFGEIRNAAGLGDKAPSQAVAQSASTELAGRLKEAGIQTIRVSANDGRVSAEGRLSEQQASQWSSIQRWFDGKYASSAVLTANVAIGQIAGPPPVRLQAVWFGQRPYIIADNGSRYYEGAILESGWSVQRIAEDRVVLGRDGETLALTYR